LQGTSSSAGKTHGKSDPAGNGDRRKDVSPRGHRNFALPMHKQKGKSEGEGKEEGRDEEWREAGILVNEDRSKTTEEEMRFLASLGIVIGGRIKQKGKEKRRKRGKSLLQFAAMGDRVLASQSR